MTLVPGGMDMNKLILAAVTILLMGSTAASAAIIDDFQAGEYELGREGDAPPVTVGETQYDPTFEHILGGRRDVTLEKLTGSGTQPYVNVNPSGGEGSGVATYNSDFGCNAVWTMAYGLGGPMDADLTGADSDAVLVELIGGDLYSGPRPVPLTVAVSGGGATAEVTVELIEEGVYILPFADYPGVDFSHVDLIEVRIVQDSSINDAVDFALGYIATGSIEAVDTTRPNSWGAVKALFN